MIAVDTNVLARFYVDDPGDPESARQRPVAHRLFANEPAIFVPVTVLLELEWVVRAFYGFDPAQFVAVVHHLCGLPNVTIEDRTQVVGAAELHTHGLDFADALHLARSAHCDTFYTFDDRGFPRRARRHVVEPRIEVPR